MNNIKSSRAVTYARVSSQEQAAEGTSMDFQDSQLTAYCQFQKWDVINSYTDPGYTGKDGNRPGLTRLLADAKIGLFDRVVVYKLDRLARNLRLLLEIEQTLKASGVILISIKESIDTSTPTGKMMFQMFGMVAEWERETIIERTKSGRLQRYKDGCWSGGRVLYGYAYDKPTKKLMIDETSAIIVRRIFQEYRDGKTLYGICTRLNRDNVHGRGRKSQGWRPTGLRNLLLNPAYKGTQIVHRYSHINFINRMDLSDAIKIQVPPIIDEQTWNIAQERLMGNKHIRPKKEGEFLLQGMITCGYCGHVYHAERDAHLRYYNCVGKMKSKHIDGSPRCTNIRLKAAWLEEEVWRRVEEIVNDPNRLSVVINETIQSLRLKEADLNARIKPIEGRLAEIAEQKAKLADDWVERNMNPEKFKELKDNLDKEESRISSLKSKIDPAEIRDLENTRGMLLFWEDQLKSMAWNTESEDGKMFKVVEEPHKIALKMISFDNKELSDDIAFPASKRDMLNKLQLKLVVFNDRIELNALFPIEAINLQYCTSIRE